MGYLYREEDFQPTGSLAPRPADIAGEIEAERTWYPSGQIRSERVRARRRERYAFEEERPGCLVELFQMYVGDAAFVAAAFFGGVITGDLWGAALGLGVWVLFVYLVDL